MEKLVTRAYNRFEVDETRGVVRKLSSTERLRDEILYYVKLQKYHPSQAVFFPRLLDHVEPLIADFWMDLELYSYPNVGNYLFGDKIMPSWSEFFLNLRNILVSWSNISPRVKWTDEEIRNAAYDMYIKKQNVSTVIFILDGTISLIRYLLTKFVHIQYTLTIKNTPCSK